MLGFRLYHFKLIFFVSRQAARLLTKIQIFSPIDFQIVGTHDNKNIKMLDASDGRGEVRNATAPLVLIVDDDEDSRLMLKLLLEMWKYRVVEAADGSEAVNVAENARPDLIVMDVKLPDLDGFGVTRQIRQSAKIESVPIVFLSGCAEPNYKQKAVAVGGNEYLVKPLNFEDLENTLGKYISHSQEV